MHTAEGLALAAHPRPRKRAVVNMGWQLDRHVNLSVLLAVFIQTAVIAYSLGGLYNRVERVEVGLIAVQPQADRVTRLEERLHAIEVGVQEIKVLLAPTRGTKR